MDEKELIELFRQKDLKVTTQRLLVTQYVLSHKDHPSADQIYNALKEDYPTISLATIYKTLNLLKDIGLVHELGFGEGAVRYDPNTHVHINLICTKCHDIKDYYPDDIESWWHQLTEKLDEEPVGQRIDIYYQCEKCKGK